MTEEEAQAWISARFGSAGREAMEALVSLVLQENDRQNLIAPSTSNSIWSRHVADSAQLIDLAAGVPGRWLDIGTGAGFPGLVVAALSGREVEMVEPRKRRAAFLEQCCATLNLLGRARVLVAKVEAVSGDFAVMSARAVASLPDIFAAAQQCSTRNTLWLLPKGRGAREEIANAEKAWHAVFHVEQSITDPEAMIVTARQVRRR